MAVRVAVRLLCVAVLACCCRRSRVDAALSLSVYNNTALAGPPASTEALPGFSYNGSLTTPPPAGLVATGTLAYPPGTVWVHFACSFASIDVGFVWIDDHQVRCCRPSLCPEAASSSRTLLSTLQAPQAAPPRARYRAPNPQPSCPAVQRSG